MSVKRIAKEVLKINPNLEGYFRYNINSNTYYTGKIKNSKRNGYGELYRDGKILWEGIWIDDNKIDDVDLPNDMPIEEKEMILDTCQKLTFKFTIEEAQLEFDLTYSVPSKYMYNLHKIIDKVIKQTNYSLDEKDISVTVDNSECDLSRDTIHKMLEIDHTIQYINHLDFECSSCRRFNRGWECCGQFAPFLYMYHILLYENEFETRYKDRFGQNGVAKPSQIYNIANVFYKMFTGYAGDDYDYNQMRDNIQDLYGTNVPNHIEKLDFWIRRYPDKQIYEINETFLALDNGKSYLILLTDGYGTEHYCYVYRHNDDVILCDSWAHQSDQRSSVLRIMKHDEFIKCVAKINELCRFLHSPKEAYENDDELLHDMLLYNFILDALFLIPYNPIDIKKGRQTFYGNDLYYIAFIDPKQVHAAFNYLENSSPEPFNMYLNLGGSKKRKGKTHKKRKNNKKTHKIKK